MKVKLIKYPTKNDWMFCKQCALVTVGKDAITEPTQEWKHKVSCGVFLMQHLQHLY